MELLWCEGNLEAARSRCDEVLALIGEKESPWYAGSTSGILARKALILLALGNEGGCRALLEEALRTAVGWVERPPVATAIDAIAAFAVRTDPPLAATLLGAAVAARGAFDESSLDAPAARAAARGALGSARFDEAFQRGSDLGYEEGIALARSFVRAALRPVRPVPRLPGGVRHPVWSEDRLAVVVVIAARTAKRSWG